MTLIYFIIVLGVTVLIHELGHFIFAKRADIYVYEFAIGMGPRIFKWKRKNDETIYSIRLFPIGGFVSMAGEDIEEDPNIPKDRQLQSKSWIDRFLTIVAGVVFNFLLAIVLLFIVGLVNGVPNNKPIIASLDPNYPAYESGLKVNDQIISINGKKVKSTDRMLVEMQINVGLNIEIGVKHEDGTTENIKIKPILTEKNGESSYLYGFTLDNSYETGFVPALKYSFTKTYNLLEQMGVIIKYLITGKLSLDNLAGPVGIFNVVGESAKAGIISILYLIAYLCVNVGFINLIPLPAFDGGRLLFLIIEKIKGSKVNPKVENTIHSIGLALLMILMVVITYNDIIRLFK